MIAGSDVARHDDGHADMTVRVRMKGEDVKGAVQLELAALVGGHVGGVDDDRVAGGDG